MTNNGWKIPYGPVNIPQCLVDTGYTPLLSLLLALRGVTTPYEAKQIIEGGTDCIFDPMLMLNMEKAVLRINQAIDRREMVCVFGDYDVDGITATCIVSDYLLSRGINCIPYIPDRSEEGYGLNCTAISSLKEKGVKLVITVDCGITAREEAAFARELGMDIIITDHHEYSEASYPAEAVAVVDTKQPGDTYPNRYLAGVGVALKLVCAIENNSSAILEKYSDLVAIGTVADVMPLVGENRHLVKLGLSNIKKSPRPGIAAMLKESSIDIKKLTAVSIGYSIAPKLNAAGRVGTPITAVKLLMTKSHTEAAAVATTLCHLNALRQSIELGIWESAVNTLEIEPPTGPIVLAGETWHQGVIGIAASRLADYYHYPAIMICLNGDVGKGSCRSYGGFNLFEALSACKEYLIGFGGHALAAGLNIHRDKIDDFRKALGEYYLTHKPEPVPEVLCDVHITDPALLSLDNVSSLDLLEPFGNSNPKPIMCMTDVTMESAVAVGSGKHLKLRVRLGDTSFDGIFFSHTAEELGVQEGCRVDVAFTPTINEFRGHVSVQLSVCALRRHDPYGLCDAIINGDEQALYSACRYKPERADFVALWKIIRYGSFRAGENVEAIIAQCLPDMAPETFALCLTVLLEAGLLRSENSTVFGSVPSEISGKADLESTRIMRTLNGHD